LNSYPLSGDDDDMFASSHDDDLYEGEGTPFGKGGGLFSGSGALFDNEGEEGDDEKPSRKQDLEASIRSKSTAAGGGDLFGDEGEE
jgi:hypothetical protein